MSGVPPWEGSSARSGMSRSAPAAGLLFHAQRAPKRQVKRRPVTSGSFPGHDSRSGVAPWAGQIDEPAPVRALADGAGEASRLAVRFDPLIHPVAITGHCAIGDQIRVPAAWCAMAGCEAAFADPAALGEADNRVRAVTAGWAEDALCRLVCPGCQRDRPVPPWWVPVRAPSTVSDHRPASGTSRPTGATSQSAGPPAVAGEPPAAAGEPPAAAGGLHHRTPWPRLLSALVSSRDGWASRAGSRVPDAGTMQGQVRTSAPRHGQAMHAARSAGRRA
jgi:hypothetical protein